MTAVSLPLTHHKVLIRCLQHADSDQDLKARAHPWRLPRVSVPFAGSEHHKAASPAHAVHTVLSRRRSARAQGFKLQCRRVRAMPPHAVHQGPPWLNFDGALHHFQATYGGTGTGDVAEGQVVAVSRAKASLSIGPSAGSARDAGAEQRVPKSKRSKAKKRKLAIAKEMEEEGGFALLARGEVRRQGVFVPIGNERTCLPDALHVGMADVRPSLQLQQSVTRSALMSEASGPTFAMAKLYAAQHGIDLKYDRTLNCPQRLRVLCEHGTVQHKGVGPLRSSPRHLPCAAADLDTCWRRLSVRGIPSSRRLRDRQRARWQGTWCPR